jgi:hypothetical protein
MKVLIDECAPRALKHYLAARHGHFERSKPTLFLPASLLRGGRLA